MINTQDLRPEELRIGNIINPEGDFHTVAGIQFNGVEYWIAYKEYFEWFRFKGEKPIPLSEEWLIKFGITKYEDITSEHFFGGGLYHLGNDEWLISYNNEFHFIRDRSSSAYDGSTEYRTTVIKYVHHLQNIYFAHKFEELTIKE